MAVFMTGVDYLTLPRPKEQWIVKDLLPVGGSLVIFGAAKTGKSFAAIGIAMAITKGLDEWLDFPVLTHGPVAYLNIDTPRALLTDYLVQVTDAGHDPSEIYFTDPLLVPPAFDILNVEHQQWLRHQLDQIQPVLVIVDTLRESHSGDENDSTAMRATWSAMAQATSPAALLFVHHAKKPGENGFTDIKQSGRGSNYVNGKADFIGMLTGKHFQVEGRSKHTGTREIKRAECGLIVLDGVALAKAGVLQDICTTMKDDTQTAMADEYIARLIELKLDAPKHRAACTSVKREMDKRARIAGSF